MEKDKNAAKKPGCKHSQSQGNPIGVTGLNGLIHQIQYQEVRDKSIQELPDRFSDVRLFIFSDALVPNWFGGFAFEGSGIAKHIEPPFISVSRKNRGFHFPAAPEKPSRPRRLCAITPSSKRAILVPQLSQKISQKKLKL